ncbi:helix-turn-helix domain-containing protein [Pelagibius litoralis]|uniref:Helix-turn-helix domain-containing protein n=1 Tax=Pelagibius litoralis TaxID=374515 RepID=A0A967F3R1_9PROT|nr:helix-turn-helix domain-containing protein [Pelagibius litoralis]NIA72442.1 helix-turn-helix domain-containing protein [Pelagibius litoralis]
MEQILDDDRLTLSVKETARVLGIGQTSVWRIIGTGSLETIKIGGRTLVTMASIRRVAEQGAD